MTHKHISVLVAEMEAHEGGNTIWVHSPIGATVLRIKCTGKIIMDNDCLNPVAHSDMIVQGDIHLCMPAKSVPWKEFK